VYNFRKKNTSSREEKLTAKNYVKEGTVFSFKFNDNNTIPFLSFLPLLVVSNSEEKNKN